MREKWSKMMSKLPYKAPAASYATAAGAAIVDGAASADGALGVVCGYCGAWCPGCATSTTAGRSGKSAASRKFRVKAGFPFGTSGSATPRATSSAFSRASDSSRRSVVRVARCGFRRRDGGQVEGLDTHAQVVKNKDGSDRNPTPKNDRARV